MNQLSWEVIDWNIPVNFFGKNSKFSLWRHHGKNILIIQEGCTTIILEFVSKNYMLSPSNIKIMQSKANVINIFKVSDKIFMLDDSGDLFELTKTKSEWSWNWIQHLDGGLAITGLQNGVAFLRQVEKMTFIEIYKLNMSEFELQSSKKLNYCNISTNSYQVISAKVDFIKFFFKTTFKKLDSKEVVFIGDPSGFTYLFPLNKKLLPLHFEKEFLLTVLINEIQNCILLIYCSGKIMTIQCNENIKTNVLCLPNKVCAITWFNNDKSSLLWSDGTDLHISKFLGLTEIINLQINQNIKGIQHLVQLNEKIVAMTMNGGFYNIKESDEVFTNPPIIKKSEEILKEIYDVGIFVENLSRDIGTYEDFIYAVITSKMENIGRNIIASIKEKEVSIRNGTGRVFKKNLWVLKLEISDKNKRTVEIKTLENDLNKGGLINFETHLPLKKDLALSIICDLGNDLPWIEIRINRIDIPQEEQVDLVAQKLKELAHKRKLSNKNQL